MNALRHVPDDATNERSQVLLINGSDGDPRTARMLDQARALLEAEGAEVDVLDPALHSASDVYEKWLFTNAVFVIAPGGAHTLPTRYGPAIDRMAQAGYPSNLAERAYGVVVHGDGADATRRALCGWFDTLGMVDSDSFAKLDRYLGYHELDADDIELKDDADYQAEVGNVAHALSHAVTELRAGRLSPPERRLRSV